MKRPIRAGGGHAHLHLLESLAQRTWSDVERVLVTPPVGHVYSRIMPGWIVEHHPTQADHRRLSPSWFDVGLNDLIPDRVSSRSAARNELRRRRKSA